MLAPPGPRRVDLRSLARPSQLALARPNPNLRSLARGAPPPSPCALLLADDVRGLAVALGQGSFQGSEVCPLQLMAVPERAVQP